MAFHNLTCEKTFVISTMRRRMHSPLLKFEALPNATIFAAHNSMCIFLSSVMTRDSSRSEHYLYWSSYFQNDSIPFLCKWCTPIMIVGQLKPFPSHFCLRDLTAITAPVFAFKLNPHQEEAWQAARTWFDSRNVYHGRKKNKFLSHRFDSYAGMSFPDADVTHLQTCIAFFLWAFSFDDLSDEGALQSKPDAVQVGVDISMAVLNNPDAPPPDFPYAAMLHDIWKRFRSSASSGACNRFARAVNSWMKSQVEQARNRATNEIPGVAEFIVLRRRTIGGPIVEAMVEYSLDLQVPEFVWDHPILQEMSKAAIDIMTWPNDLCSFNKEQSDGDFQNLVFCIMLERGVDLQSAVDILTDMLAERVADYAELKNNLPSFGPEIDSELSKYYTALEQYVQGTVVWYYFSPRYFRGQDVSNKEDLIVPVYERTQPIPDIASLEDAGKLGLSSILSGGYMIFVPLIACLLCVSPFVFSSHLFI